MLKNFLCVIMHRKSFLNTSMQYGFVQRKLSVDERIVNGYSPPSRPWMVYIKMTGDDGKPYEYCLLMEFLNKDWPLTNDQLIPNITGAVGL